MKDKEYYQKMGGIILDACISVHRELGPGLLESVYEFALMKEFEFRNIPAKTQVGVKLFYKGFDTSKYLMIDILVDDEIIIELKAVETIHDVFKAQLISYLKLSGKHLGYLVNFNVPFLKDGFSRLVNNLTPTQKQIKNI